MRFGPLCCPRMHDVRFASVQRGGGGVYSLDRLHFGWKYSPIICQFALSEIVPPLIPKGIVLLHYMDDFLPTDLPTSLL